MDRTHEKLVEAQFGPQAKAYGESLVHAQGPDLEALERRLAAAPPAHALDLGTGGGHVAMLMARYAGTVTALDLSPAMLVALAATARKRGLANLRTVAAPVEKMPFEDGAADFVACRYSAHHW